MVQGLVIPRCSSLGKLEMDPLPHVGLIFLNPRAPHLNAILEYIYIYIPASSKAMLAGCLVNVLHKY